MTRSRYVWRALVVVAVIASALGGDHAPAAVRAGTYPPIDVPGPPGVPAITPEPALKAQALASTTVPYTATATYTVADVDAYLAAHLPAIFPTTDGQPAHVSRVLFIPARVASAYLLNEDIGRSPDTLVCYVEITGSLSTARIHRHIYYDIHTHRFHRLTLGPAHLAELVFDAQTGNLLMLSFVEGPNGTTPPTPTPLPTHTPRPAYPLPTGMPTAAPTVSPTVPS